MLALHWGSISSNIFLNQETHFGESYECSLYFFSSSYPTFPHNIGEQIVGVLLTLQMSSLHFTQMACPPHSFLFLLNKHEDMLPNFVIFNSKQYSPQYNLQPARKQNIPHKTRRPAINSFHSATQGYKPKWPLDPENSAVFNHIRKSRSKMRTTYQKRYYIIWSPMGVPKLEQEAQEQYTEFYSCPCSKKTRWFKATSLHHTLEATSSKSFFAMGKIGVQDAPRSNIPIKHTSITPLAPLCGKVLVKIEAQLW